MQFGKIDHVAIAVEDFGGRIDQLTGTGALRVIRHGKTGNGQRLAMLGDGTGMKIEIVESAGDKAPRFLHVAATREHARATRALPDGARAAASPGRARRHRRRRDRGAGAGGAAARSRTLGAAHAVGPPLIFGVGPRRTPRRVGAPRPVGRESRRADWLRSLRAVRARRGGGAAFVITS